MKLTGPSSLFITLFFLSGSAHAIHHRVLTKQERYEHYLITRIRNLKQVKGFFAYNGKRSRVMIDKTPDSFSKTYNVVVGISQPSMFFTFWRFEIDPKTNKITVEDDTDTDDNIFIPLQLWQKWFYDPRFNKPHHYKNGQIYLSK
jgi:hypothetical protein